MSALRLRNLLIVLAASAGLGACAGPFGYGGISAGYGNYGGYGYPYGGSYYGSRYGYMPSYYGWYDNLYYPGVGYYVYDRWGHAYRWSDPHRRYWEGRRDPDAKASWGDFFRRHREARAASGTQQSVSPTVVTQSSPTRETIRAERRQARQEARVERRQSRQETTRPTTRSDRPLLRRVNRDERD